MGASAFTSRHLWCLFWQYFALLWPFQALDVSVVVITSDSGTEVMEAMEAMAVTAGIGMGMVAVIMYSMDMVIMVTTRRFGLAVERGFKNRSRTSAVAKCVWHINIFIDALPQQVTAWIQ
jgi:hypothetical protein